jgi:hypothetical protein
MRVIISNILVVFIISTLSLIIGCNKKNPDDNHSYSKVRTFEDDLKKTTETEYTAGNYKKKFLMKKESYFSDTICFYNNYDDPRIFFLHDKKVIWLHEDEYFIDYLKRVKPYIVWNQINQKNIGKFFWYIINGYGGYPLKGDFLKNTLPILWKLNTEFHSKIYPDSLIYMQFKTFELKTRTKHKEEFFYFFKNNQLELKKLTTDTLKKSEIQTIE